MEGKPERTAKLSAYLDTEKSVPHPAWEFKMILVIHGQTVTWKQNVPQTRAKTTQRFRLEILLPAELIAATHDFRFFRRKKNRADAIRDF
jgi:hypothetical protein